MAVSKNPTWTKDELILLLDLYFELDVSDFSKNHPKIIALSELLNRFLVHAPAYKNSKFRNPVGVHMKLRNLGRFDANYRGRGLERGGKLEQEIWRDFSEDRSKLRATARAIRENATRLESRELSFDQTSLEEVFPEGRILTRVHQIRERNPVVVARKKKTVLKATGKLACEVCGFDFFKKYGELGFGYAECHHTSPLASLRPGSVTKVSDLAIVCSNCHRILHRTKKWLSIVELKKIVTGISTHT